MAEKDSLGRFVKGHSFGKRFQKGSIPWTKLNKGYKCKQYNLSEEGKLQKIKNLGTGMLGKKQSIETINKIKIGNIGKKVIHTEEAKKKLRLSMIEHIKKYRGGFKTNIGKHEKEILDFIESSLVFPILRQYEVDGYFVDGYLKERNIVFEIDEKPKITQKEISRENYIINKLNWDSYKITIFEGN